MPPLTGTPGSVQVYLVDPATGNVRQTQFAANKRIVQNYRPTVWGLYHPELLRIGEN